MDMAQGFWALLLPHGLQGGALSHIASREADGDDRMAGPEAGWQDEHTQWWFEFLTEKKLKGVSKDVWQMVRARVSPSAVSYADSDTRRYLRLVPGVCAHHRRQVREVRHGR